jgi:F420H(2)-dependent quinone reductase
MLNTEGGLDGEYVPSAVARVRKQVAEYEASGGVEGATLEGRPVVILTSVGAKSGKVRKNPVMRIVDGDRYVAVASYGGAPKTRPGTPTCSPTRRCDFRTARLSRTFTPARSAAGRSSGTGRSPSSSGRTFPNTGGWPPAATSRSWCSSPSRRPQRTNVEEYKGALSVCADTFRAQTGRGILHPSTWEAAGWAVWRSAHPATPRSNRRTRLPRCQVLTKLRPSVALSGFPLCSSGRFTLFTR